MRWWPAWKCSTASGGGVKRGCRRGPASRKSWKAIDAAATGDTAPMPRSAPDIKRTFVLFSAMTASSCATCGATVKVGARAHEAPRVVEAEHQAVELEGEEVAVQVRPEQARLDAQPGRAGQHVEEPLLLLDQELADRARLVVQLEG